MRRALLLLSLSCFFVLGCGGDSGDAPDGSTPSPMSCGSTPAMQIGRCVLTAGGECVGSPGETFAFTSLSAGDDMHMVVGPQGSTMLVFLARATGIEPGVPDIDRDPSQPIVEVTLFDASAHTQLATYRQRTGFTMDASGYTSHQLWVVVDSLASALAGRNVTAIANVTDRNGEKRCAIIDVVPRS